MRVDISSQGSRRKSRRKSSRRKKDKKRTVKDRHRRRSRSNSEASKASEAVKDHDDYPHNLSPPSLPLPKTQDFAQSQPVKISESQTATESTVPSSDRTSPTSIRSSDRTRPPSIQTSLHPDTSNDDSYAPSKQGASEAPDSVVEVDPEARWEFLLVFKDAAHEFRDRDDKNAEDKEFAQVKTSDPSFARTLCNKAGDHMEGMRLFWGIVDVIYDAGLEMRLERKNGHILCCVRASAEVIKAHAATNEFQVPLEEDEIKRLSVNGVKDHNQTLVIDVFPIRHDNAATSYKPFQYIFGRYSSDPALAPLYNPKFSKLSHSKVLLHLLEKLVVKAAHIARKFQRTALGASMLPNMEDLIQDPSHPLVAYFPLHDDPLSSGFTNQWWAYRTLPWNQPVEEIRSYFGEKIAMYFSFLGHYTTALMVLTAIGMVGAVFQVNYELSPDTPFLPIFGILVSIWAVLTMELWKRKQMVSAMEWGMLDYVKTQHARQGFWGDPLPSLETGKLEMYFPASERRCRGMVSVSIIFLLMAINTAAVVSVYILQHIIEQRGGLLEEHSARIAGMMSAMQIQIMNAVYRVLAIYINDFENHRTDSAYEESLVLKIFVFQIVNSYSSLAYIAFVKSEEDCVGKCIDELQTALAAILVIGLVIGNVTEVLLPAMINFFQYCSCCQSKDEQDEDEDYEPAPANVSGQKLDLNGAPLKDLGIEKQFFVYGHYDIVLGQLDDYAELAIQFGYITLFVVCFPLAPLIALITCWIEIRTDSYKLLKVFRRPKPSGAQSIGPWENVFVNMARLSVVSNAAILCITSNYLEKTFDLNQVESQRVFMIYVFLMLLLLFGIDVAIPDVPISVMIQYNRQAFICKTVIDRVSDDPDVLNHGVHSFKIKKDRPRPRLKKKKDKMKKMVRMRSAFLASAQRARKAVQAKNKLVNGSV